jgi:hypothetical protein
MTAYRYVNMSAGSGHGYADNRRDDPVNETTVISIT